MTNGESATDKLARAVNARSYAAAAPARLARKAVERSREDPGEAQVAIVFSAATAESFLADVIDFARIIRDASSTPTADVQAVADYGDAEKTDNLRARYQLVRLLASQTAWDKGAATWQSFKALVALRNEIAHHKPQRYAQRGNEAGAIAPALRHLENLGVLPPPRSQLAGLHYAPTGLLCTAPVAQWALAAATAVIDELVAAMPASALRQLAGLAAEMTLRPEQLGMPRELLERPGGESATA